MLSAAKPRAEREHLQKPFIREFEVGGNIKDSAHAVGITPELVSEWRKDPNFRRRMDEARAIVVQDGRKFLYRKAKGGSMDAIKEFAKANIDEYKAKDNRPRDKIIGVFVVPAEITPATENKIKIIDAEVVEEIDMSERKLLE